MDKTPSADAGFQLPPVIAESSTPNPLDALKSPPANKSQFRELTNARDSIATSSDFNDIALDDDDSPRPPRVELSVETIDEEETPDESKSQDLAESASFDALTVRAASPKPSHRKTASTTTIRSERDSQTIFSTPLDSGSRRVSVDGQAKLQEEFARLHEKESKDQAHAAENHVDWDFWGAVISDYRAFAAERPEELAVAIQRGIPNTLRGMMWQHMAASKDLELEATYLRLLKETTPHEKAIIRDLGRTFPHHAFFTDGQGIGQENLFNVLKAYSLYDPQVGYCQGLPFVVAILLLNMPDEEAFSLLVRLMTVYDLQGHFLPEMPRLQLRLFQFDRLLEETLPVLHIHFLRQGIKSSMYCSQWFLTLFSYRFPLEIVFRIYDNCLASGIEAIFGFAINLLRQNEDVLLTLKFDEILAFLNSQVLDCYLIEEEEEEGKAPRYRVDDLVKDSVSMRITSFMLDCYRHEYEDMVRETNKRAVEMDELRNINRALVNQVKALETDLAQLNTEHVEILNEVVKQRLRNEEMEQELVRYKLLYAEAVHQHEGAQQTNRLSLAQMMLGLKRGSSQ